MTDRSDHADPSRRSPRSFEIEIRLPAAPDAVWQALTEAREIERWFAPRAEAEAGLGGKVLWQWGDEHRWPLVVEAWEPGQHLRLRYDSTVADGGSGAMRPLFVDFHLEGDGGTTTLRLVHSGFGPEAAFEAEYDGISSGWPVELRSLRHYLEHHRGQPRRAAWATRSTQEDPDAVWRRLLGHDGLRAPRLMATKEGQPFTVHVAPLGALEGVADFVPSPREFNGVIDSLGKARLRAHCGRWGGATQVWLWLSLYGSHGDRAPVFEAAFDDMLERCVPAAGAAADRS